MDQCKRCSLQGDVETCELAECVFHRLWYVQNLRDRIVGWEEFACEEEAAKQKAEADLADITRRFSKLTIEHEQRGAELAELRSRMAENAIRESKTLEDVQEMSRKRERDLRAELAEAKKLQNAVSRLIANSGGVTGWHLNGDDATWEECLPEWFEGEEKRSEEETHGPCPTDNTGNFGKNAGYEDFEKTRYEKHRWVKNPDRPGQGWVCVNCGSRRSDTETGAK